MIKATGQGQYMHEIRTMQYAAESTHLLMNLIRQAVQIDGFEKEKRKDTTRRYIDTQIIAMRIAVEEWIERRKNAVDNDIARHADNRADHHQR